jgi:hypothetical protein
MRTYLLKHIAIDFKFHLDIMVKVSSYTLLNDFFPLDACLL